MNCSTHQDLRFVGITISDMRSVETIVKDTDPAIQCSDIVFWWDDSLGCWTVSLVSRSGTVMCRQDKDDGWVAA